MNTTPSPKATQRVSDDDLLGVPLDVLPLVLDNDDRLDEVSVDEYMAFPPNSSMFPHIHASMDAFEQIVDVIEGGNAPFSVNTFLLGLVVDLEDFTIVSDNGSDDAHCPSDDEAQTSDDESGEDAVDLPVSVWLEDSLLDFPLDCFLDLFPPPPIVRGGLLA
ncbi:uncharacterized protein EI90DRAFT_3072838 [Cantharellus anzutake]|uniref:uncharacterized protein n=1 Tax=Cantharellus anzutake TaxID=1750568 RepID=UPI001906B97D|nr:uncharacterized protein EI90DRAFT_3072838 [Cantharellus anzutake]KAF8325432.1 hypothetical protein EI90DRAFT_3072838 [Cantharellus anzutake]